MKKPRFKIRFPAADENRFPQPKWIYLHASDEEAENLIGGNAAKIIRQPAGLYNYKA